MIRKDAQQVEFSRFVARDKLAEGESDIDIEADADERQALARRFGLLSLDSLRARVRLRFGRAGAVLRVTGHLEAEVRQACVVTLEPVQNRIEEDFSLSFSLEEPRAAGGEVVIEVEDEETPEPLAAEGLDVGEVVAQQLALAIDPYPRAEGVSLEDVDWPGRPAERAGEEGPFAVLKSLKARH